jgi:PAS domain S-box-containing protein
MDDEALGRVLLDALGAGVLAVDATGAVTYTNRAAKEMLTGVAPGELPLARAIAGEEVDEPAVHVRRNGGEARFSVHARPLRAADGGVIGAVVLLRDVTAAHAEAERRARSAALAELVRAVGAAANAAASVDEAVRQTLGFVCEMLGWPLGHAMYIDTDTGAFVSSGIWVGEAPPLLREESALVHSRGVLHAEALASGQPLWIEGLGATPGIVRVRAFRQAGVETVLAVPVLAGGRGVGMLEFFARERVPRDEDVLVAVSQVGMQLGRCFERRDARAREDFVQAIVDHVADPIFVKDRASRWVYLSRAFCELVGYPREAMIGKTDHDFFPKEQADFFHEKDREMFRRESRVVIEEEPITDARGELHWLATTKVPLRGPSGEVTHLVGAIHDITRVKAAEEELSRKNAELARQVSDTTSALIELDVAHRELETFSYTVSHDLRAPLRAVLGYSAMLVSDAGEHLAPESRRYLERIELNTRRMAQLIDDLLALSRVSRAGQERVPVDVSSIASHFLDELASGDAKRHVVTRVEPGIVVSGDPGLLRIAFENLLRNAWKFTAGRDPAHIEVGRAGDEIFVRDDGAGFDMTYADRLFRPFSRLHGMEEFPGSGIGLATVERIARRHGGSVRAEGEVGKGATFYVRLP